MSKYLVEIIKTERGVFEINADDPSVIGMDFINDWYWDDMVESFEDSVWEFSVGSITDVSEESVSNG